MAITTNKTESTTKTTTTTTKTTTNAAASEYEKTREQRIKENRERLQKLGIVDLSLQLNSISSTSSRRHFKTQFERRSPLKSPSLGPLQPSRRSSRLQNAPPVTYIELKEERSRARQGPRRSRAIVLEVGSQPEVYTEEHDKLLGSTEMPWTFFVDGYGPNGSRIYDQVNGKTCHQCRQKTLGQRTRCSRCTLVQGQFCGDCLYMRYGEHVVEANQNANWICPPCRGICNCSLCRKAKGWPPTGALYRSIINLGYKSVAHYLIDTKRAPPEVDTNSDTEQSAKRCLPFEGIEIPSDVASDEKGTDSNTEPSRTPEGVRRSGRTTKKENAGAGPESAIKSKVAEDQPVPEKRSLNRVGRPLKKSKKESVVSQEESLSEDVIENGFDSEMRSRRGVGRPPGKKSNKENINEGVKTLTKDVIENGFDSGIESPKAVGRPRKRPQESLSMDNQPVSEKRSTKSVGRPRKKSKKENVADGESLDKDVTKNGSDSKMKSPRGVGRPRKNSKKENIDIVKEYLSEDVSKNGSDSELKSPRGVGRPQKQSKKIESDEKTPSKDEMKSPRAVGRPRKRPEKENVEGVAELLSKDVTENGFDSEKKNRDISSSMTDSVARRLRPRKKN
ncbi:hypothetical protein vseg_005176 [Gypsophila vaccaria]